MYQLALFAGSAAAAIFMISQLPMLIKARRTKDLGSYSLANIALANLGNVLYTLYLTTVPVGPVWAVHAFNLTTGTLMLCWYLRYGRRRTPEARSGTAEELLDSSGERAAADPASPRGDQPQPALVGAR